MRKHSLGWDANPPFVDSVNFMSGVSRKTFGPMVQKFFDIAWFSV